MPKTVQTNLDVALTSLCGRDGVEFKGKKYTPDLTKGYFTFSVAHAFPVVTVAGEALYPSVIAKSYSSMVDQKIDWEHQIALYHQGNKDVRDRVIGSIKDVDFPGGPNSQWKVDPDVAKSPCISGVGAIFKETQGSASAFGGHVVGNKRLTVSMECSWALEDAGFAVSLNGGKPSLTTDSPADLVAAGYEYVAYAKAPAALQACYSTKHKRIHRTYQGRKVAILMGGLDTPVHFMGLAICRFGAEPTAKINGLYADANSEMLKRLLFFEEALTGWSSRHKK
jgi:hypothetical protein